ncbi:hypothetical protein QYF36_003383 [Acer negundo]|nr:hypothetical protein QYF36_003383 [Acer negundo]
MKLNNSCPAIMSTNMVYVGEWERVLRACLVQIDEVDADYPFPIFFLHHDHIGYPAGIMNSLTDPMSIRFWILSLMTLFRSGVRVLNLFGPYALGIRGLSRSRQVLLLVACLGRALVQTTFCNFEIQRDAFIRSMSMIAMELTPSVRIPVFQKEVFFEGHLTELPIPLRTFTASNGLILKVYSDTFGKFVYHWRAGPMRLDLNPLHMHDSLWSLRIAACEHALLLLYDMVSVVPSYCFMFGKLNYFSISMSMISSTNGESTKLFGAFYLIEADIPEILWIIASILASLQAI